jgi:hypothetical protein
MRNVGVSCGIIAVPWGLVIVPVIVGVYNKDFSCS